MFHFLVTKPNLCQRHVLKLRSLHNPVKRSFSIRSALKPLITERAKVGVSVISFSACIGYLYLADIKNVTNFIPTAHCESIQNDSDPDTKSVVELKENNDLENKQRLAFMQFLVP